MSTFISASQSQAIVKKVYRAFFTPSQYEVKTTDHAILARGSNFRIPFEGESWLSQPGARDLPSC